MLKSRVATIGFIAALLATGAIVFVLGPRHKMSGTGSSSTITAVLSGKLTFPLAPENISTIPLYHIHRNLWGTLLGEHGKPELASLLDVSSDEKTFRFELLPAARFSNGRQITSEDVIFSFHRLMSKQTPGHFSAKSLIEDLEIDSPSRFEIRLKEKTAAFTFLLSTPEMGIVPKEACNSAGDIVDPGITSGPYFVDGMPQPERVVLRENPYFVSLPPQAPRQVIVLLRSGVEALMKSLNNEHADFVEYYSYISPELLKELRSKADLGLTITRPSFSVFISANPKTLSENERKSIAQVLHERLKYPMTPELERRSSQILPPGTFGSLDDGSASIPNLQELDLPSHVRIASFDKKGHLLDSITSALASAGVKSEVIPFGKSMDFDLAFLGQGMNTDYPEIEFYLNMLSRWAFISATPHDRQLIMDTIHASDRAARSKNIQAIGRDVLNDARVIPLAVRSYVHVYRKDRLRIDQASSYDGEVPFWKMQMVRP